MTEKIHIDGGGYTDEEKRHRKDRLSRVLTTIEQVSAGFKINMLDKIISLYDHKGELTVEWMQEYSDEETLIISFAWEMQGELGENIKHEITKQKLPRINMAFSPDNLDYLQRISRLKGVSMTSYTNELIKSDCRANKGLIDKANELLKKES